MKKLLRFTPILVALSLITLGSCRKLITLKANINGGTVTFTIAPQSAGTYDDMRNVTIDIQKELEDNGVDINKLKKLYIKTATFTIKDTTASPITFDIVNNAQLEIGSTAAALPLKKIAWKDPVPAIGATTMDADVDGSIDLLPYAKAGDVQYHVFGTLNSNLSHPIDLKVDLTWTIEF